MGVVSWLDRKLFPQAQRAEWGTVGVTVPPRQSGISVSGAFVDQASTLGLATAGAALRLVSETVGLAPLKVYSGEKPDVTEARDSWQWFRLKEQPNDEQDAFAFWTDAAGSIESQGDAFIWKNLVRRPVRGAEDITLYLIDPGRVQVKRDEQGRKYYEVWRNGQRERVPASQMLQIRGWSADPGADRGLSAISQYREILGQAVSAQQYAARFYSNGATVPGFITTPGTVSQDDVDQLRKQWEERHAGVMNAHAPAVLSNGAGWVPSGINQRDAQYIETQQFSAEEVCRAMRVTPQMLGLKTDSNATPDQVRDQFLTVDMAPRYRRIEMAVGRDPDLFPAGSDLFPEFLTSAILKPSLQARMAAYKDSRQASLNTSNELRALENYPPVDGGDELQETPVGGAPNPRQTQGATDE